MKYKVLLGMVSLSTLVSCKEEFLERNPTTAISFNQAVATANDMQVALNGAYAGLRGVDFYGRTLPVIGDVMADNAYQSALNTNRYTQFNRYNYNVADGNASGIWNTAYSVILRANNIINAPVDTTGNATVSQYKGEAYAIRALSYFSIVRYFARPYTDNPSALGVPIVTAFNPSFSPSRSSVGEVYDLIISDLNKAYGLMTQFKNSSQFSKYAARGLQAKVYLTMGRMAEAKAAALDVINNSGFQVVGADDYVAYWNSPAIRTDKLETLFEVSSDAVGNLAFDALSYLYSQEGNYGDYLVSTELYNTYEEDDVRRDLFPETERNGSDVIAIAKYPSILGDRSDTKVLRMSEMYLIAAEASLPDNEVDALLYLNYIRARRGVDPIVATGDALFEAIIEERRRELALEGDRYMDLQRLMRDVVRGTDYPAAARVIPYSDPRRILPIPQAERDANPNVEQNPDY